MLQNPLLYLSARLWSVGRPRESFVLGSIWKADIRVADIVTVYGCPPIMSELGRMLDQQLQPGSVVIVNSYEIPGWRAKQIVYIEGSLLNPDGPSDVFLYEIGSHRDYGRDGVPKVVHTVSST